jgi:arylsulfatase A-like enzyme
VIRRALAVCVRASAAVLAALAASVAACRPAGPEPPNVLLIVVDTTRADRCSVSGYARDTTPRIADLARSGVSFVDAWSPSPWTVPAHASLFTGVHPSRLRLVGATHAQLYGDWTTMAEHLGGAGWVTASFSCNPYVSPAFGLTQGFDTTETYGVVDAGSAPLARLATQRALGWMRAQSRASKRFFAFVNLMEPHASYDPPAEFAKRFLREGTPADVEREARAIAFPRTMTIGLGAEQVSAPVLAAASDLYDAEIAVADAEIGALLDGLRAEGTLDRTLVVVCSDHGEGLGDHGWIEHAIYLHRTLLHVPLVLRLPGVFDGGRTVRDVVRLEDVFPTVLRACDVPMPPEIDGAPLTGDLAGRVARGVEKASPDWVERATRAVGEAAAAPVRPARRSVYDGRHHLIVDSTGRKELYDVAADPRETRDLAAQDPATVARLEALLPPAPPE